MSLCDYGFSYPIPHAVSMKLQGVYEGSYKYVMTGRKNKMGELKAKGNTPDYKGDGVAVWIKQDKNGKDFLSICVAGSINVCAFKYEPKPKE